MEILKYKQPILYFVSEVENIFRNHQVDNFLKTIVQDSSMLKNQDELLVFMDKYYRLMDQQMFIVSIILTKFVLLPDQDIAFFSEKG